MTLDSKKELHPIYMSEYGLKIIYRFAFQPGAITFRLHWHEHMELLRIRQGSLNLSCANRSLTLLPEDVALISSRLLHAGIAGPEGVVYDVIQVDFGLLRNSTTVSDAYLAPLCDGSCQFEPLVRNQQITEHLDRIVDARRDSDRQHPVQLLAMLYALAGLLYRHCVIREVTGLSAGRQMEAVIDYINDHYTENISSALLAEKFGHEEAYFCRKFKKYIGLTIMKYIQILRMEKARRQLTETTLSIQDIAAGCGFADTAYFNNCFKKLYGITPSRMRQRAADNSYSFADRDQYPARP